MNKIIPLILFFGLLILSFPTKGQSVISLKNASFEGKPQYSRLPKKWRVCNFFHQSPPDTQPGAFEVTKKAYDGETYVGMIVRKDGTWESFGQDLESPMLKNQAYEFSIVLGRSENYLSFSKRSRKVRVNYIDPVKFRIWGGANTCEKAELLAETDAVEHFDWRRYEFILRPKGNYTFLMFEVFSSGKILGGADGHLLLDAASDIIPISNASQPKINNR